jgi:DNA-binding HxlR family transcriptional regulator
MSSEAILNLHPLLSDRVRLAIMVALASSKEPIEFVRLQEMLEVTKGNLSSHLRKLEEEKLLKMKKEFVERKPRTTYECTAQGSREVDRYLLLMEQMLKQIKSKKN